MSLAEELAEVRRQVKTQEKEIRRRKEENEFLADMTPAGGEGLEQTSFL